MLHAATSENVKIQYWGNWYPKKGEVYYCDLGQNIGSEQNGIRPVIVVSNNMGNKHSSIVQVAPITSQKKHQLPTHVTLTQLDGLKTTSTACLEQIRCVSKERFFINGNLSRITEISNYKLQEINNAILITYELGKILI